MNTHEAVRHLCKRAADAFQADKADVALRVCAAAAKAKARRRSKTSQGSLCPLACLLP